MSWLRVALFAAFWLQVLGGVALTATVRARHRARRRPAPSSAPCPAIRRGRQDRPILRRLADAEPEDPRLGTCPVCGMDDDPVWLDGSHRGWPAHAACTEWLGEKEPPSWVLPVPRRLRGAELSDAGAIQQAALEEHVAMMLGAPATARHECPCGLVIAGEPDDVFRRIAGHQWRGDCSFFGGPRRRR